VCVVFPSCVLNLAKRTVAFRVGLVRMYAYGVALPAELEEKREVGTYVLEYNPVPTRYATDTRSRR
jgi:hypothetical protein